MEQQMSLFEEGGMKDDGLDRDPVSGNEIPPGSLAKEVRDDIPAQLSDGEYVVPADVVQYFGVKFFEDIRAEAKRGLAEMEATGRIGGEDRKMVVEKGVTTQNIPYDNEVVIQLHHVFSKIEGDPYNEEQFKTLAIYIPEKHAENYIRKYCYIKL